MKINASDILGQEVGATASFEITDERPELPDLQLADGLSGQVDLLRVDFGLVASGRIAGDIMLECHRCLQTFVRPTRVSFSGEFARPPVAEQWLIAADNTIELSPLIRQELLLTVPIKVLCRPDCPGLCDICGKKLDRPHRHPQKATISNIRIVKERN